MFKGTIPRYEKYTHLLICLVYKKKIDTTLILLHYIWSYSDETVSLAHACLLVQCMTAALLNCCRSLMCGFVLPLIIINNNYDVILLYSSWKSKKVWEKNREGGRERKKKSALWLFLRIPILKNCNTGSNSVWLLFLPSNASVSR